VRSNPPERCSDRDREAIAERLRVALGSGELSQSEFTDRITRVFDASTREQLAALVADLAAVEPVVPPQAGIGIALSLFGSQTVRPRRETTLVISVLGHARVQLGEGEEGARRLVLVNLLGSVRVLVGPRYRLHIGGVSFLGARHVSKRLLDASGEVPVTITALSLLGSVRVSRWRD